MLFVLRLHKIKYHDRELAKVELSSLYHDIKPEFAEFGPLMDQKGVMWMFVKDIHVAIVEKRAPRLGYIQRIDALIPSEAGEVKYKGKTFTQKNIFTRTDEDLIKASVNKRKFLLNTAEGTKEVIGYLGDTDPIGPKGLPVIEARLLVNLSFIKDDQTFLDPFAGIGGIVIDAIQAGYKVSSADISEKVYDGLKALGSNHVTADASRLPFTDNSFDSISTELPYSDSTLPFIPVWVHEILRVVKTRGKVVIMCSRNQAKIIRKNTSNHNLSLNIETKRGGKKVQILRIDK